MSFLEDGLWFKGEDSDGKREDDRWKILEPLGVPSFLANQLCTDLNGYFGYVFAHTGSPSTATGSRQAYLCGAQTVTWFRILTKKVLMPLEPREPDGKDYLWYEMGIFTQWSEKNTCRILCTATPPKVRTELTKILATEPKLELRDPFAMLRPLLDEVIRCCDENTWRLSQQVRAVEKKREEIPSFESLHNLLRHTCHLVEVENVAIETMEHLVRRQESNFTLLSKVLLQKDRDQAKEYLAFQLQMMKSLKWRAQASHDRLQGEINLAFNMLASTDSQIMKSITLLTMIFLPATFVSALFSTTFFSFTEDGWQFSHSFWIYWVVVVPLTVAVLVAWWWWLGGSPKTIRARWLRATASNHYSKST
ncbi:hypothetical protein DL95DRAFT_413483 [Leptodontidium sp. 2 PMI_412]|nr:hypothetical protein DL95DRAFT_413483 [Leptodontidium sp. 2 PMI_412]